MNIAVVGAQWGDEGKGKIVDLLARRFSIVLAIRRAQRRYTRCTSADAVSCSG